MPLAIFGPPSLGSPRGHNLRICWTVYRHQGGVLHDIGLVAISAVRYAFGVLNKWTRRSKAVVDSSIYIDTLLLAIDVLG